MLHTVQVYMRLWCRTATWKVRPPKASLSVEKSRVSCCRLVGASHWDASHWDVAPIKRRREKLAVVKLNRQRNPNCESLPN